MNHNHDFKIKDGVLIKYIGTGEEACFTGGAADISAAAFVGCESLQKVTLPKGCTEIGMYAFHNCKKLQTISHPRPGQKQDFNIRTKTQSPLRQNIIGGNRNEQRN